MTEQSWLAGIEPADARERITDVNDGIIAVAGMGLGLAGAEVDATTSYAIVCISAFVGALSVFGTKLGESFADKEAEQATIAEEQRLLELTPAEEMAELSDWFEAKGVSPETARAVAQELSAADALSAQLEIEYGIRELTTTRDAWQDGLWAGLAFLLGAMAPFLTVALVPIVVRTEWILAIAGASLILTSLILSRRGHSRIQATVIRSLIVGVGTLTASYLLGDWLI